MTKILSEVTAVRGSSKRAKVDDEVRKLAEKVLELSAHREEADNGKTIEE